MFPLRLSGYFFFNFLFWTSSFLISFSGLSFSLFLAYFLYLFFLFGFSYPFSYLFLLSISLYLFLLFVFLIRSSSPIFFPNLLPHPSILFFYSILLFYSSFLFFFAILLYNSSLLAFILTHPPAFPLSFFMLTFFILGKKNSNIYWQISQSGLY